MNHHVIFSVLTCFVLCMIATAATFIATDSRPRNSREFFLHVCYFVGATFAYAFLWSLLFL